METPPLSPTTARPRIRERPEDFFVEELPRDPATGHGEFARVWVEKRLLNTDEAAALLARAADLPADQVSWAGRKDRRAVTRQAFSLPWRAAAALEGFAERGLKVLAIERHDRRLGLGKSAGNRFVLQVRGLEAPEAQRAEQKLASLCHEGLPNRYGHQRFGQLGDNAERGRAILMGEMPRGERRQATLMVSALQAAVFNEVLRRRPRLDEIWQGDVGYVHATAETWWLQGSEEDQRRARAFEISATGPIFGTKMKRAHHRAGALEAEVMALFRLPAPERLILPRGLSLFGDRRPLRVPLADASSTFEPASASLSSGSNQHSLELRFQLPPGSYATVVLDELFPDGYDEGPDPEGAVELSG